MGRYLMSQGILNSLIINYMPNTMRKCDIQFFADLQKLGGMPTDAQRRAVKDAVKRIEREKLPFYFGFDLFRSDESLTDHPRIFLAIRICLDALKRSRNRTQVVTERSRAPLRLYFFGGRSLSPKDILGAMVRTFIVKKGYFFTDDDLVLIELIFGLDLDPTPEDVAYFEGEMKKFSR